MKLYTVDYQYLDYLKEKDSHVMIESVGDKRRSYIGVLIKLGKQLYIAPLSSPKKKHVYLEHHVDVFLLGKKEPLGAINFNNMIPVKKSVIKPVWFNRMTDKLYQVLLMKQYRIIKANKYQIMKQASKTLQLVTARGESDFSKRLIKRSCDFKRLEYLARYY